MVSRTALQVICRQNLFITIEFTFFFTRPFFLFLKNAFFFLHFLAIVDNDFYPIDQLYGNYNHSFYVFIDWNCFLGDRYGPWASSFKFAFNMKRKQVFMHMINLQF